jgi:hypothetical protein
MKKILILASVAAIGLGSVAATELRPAAVAAPPWPPASSAALRPAR